MNGVPPGIYVLKAAMEGLDTFAVAKVEYSGVGIKFMTALNMYTLTNGEILLEPVLKRHGRDLFSLPTFDSMQIGLVQMPDQAMAPDTILYFKERNPVHANEEIFLIKGTTTTSLTNMSISLLLQAPNSNDFFFNSWRDAKLDGSDFYIILNPFNLNIFLTQLFPGKEVSVRLRSDRIGQIVESNAQPLP